MQFVDAMHHLTTLYTGFTLNGFFVVFFLSLLLLWKVCKIASDSVSFSLTSSLFLCLFTIYLTQWVACEVYWSRYHRSWQQEENSASCKQTMVLAYGGPKRQKSMTAAFQWFTALYYSFSFFFLLEIESNGWSSGSFRYFSQIIHHSLVLSRSHYFNTWAPHYLLLSLLSKYPRCRQFYWYKFTRYQSALRFSGI